MYRGQIHLLAPLVLASLLVCPVAGRAQDGVKPEKVRFTSVDGVELHGSFFQSGKRTAPTALLLHAIGEDSRKKGWVSLAEELQKAGYNVLTFDFRGHGNSTEVQADTFWKNPSNRAGAGAKSVGKSSIDYKAFDKTYYPVLVNDIAAAKAFLDRSKNDNGVCNTSSFIVIGGETGATLGAIWLNSEWHRYKLNPPPMMFMQPQPDSRAEGKDVVCAIWLSISSKLGTRTVNPSAQLETPGRTGATPMVFMFSDDDTAGKSVAKACEKHLKVPKDDKYRFTAAVEIKGGSKLKGSGLLQKSLGTEKAIVDYLDEVVQAKGNEWIERDYRKNQYVWRVPGVAQLLPAKFTNDLNLAFDRYEKFIR